LKVIHLISGGDTGGAKTHIHYLLSGISRSIDITLVCFMRGEFADEAQALGIPTVVIEGGFISTMRQLRRMIREGGYDLLHSHGSRGNLFAALLRRGTGLPMVTTVHSDPKLDYLGRPLAALVYGNINSLALRRADYLVGVSDSMSSLLISRGFSANRIFSIYNGVDFSFEPRVPDRLSYLRSFGLELEKDSVVVGIAARLDPVKDVGTLLRGFARARKSCPQLRLAIAGSGGDAENLKALAAELGLGRNVCFTGWLSDVNSFYASLDINVLCSLSETFPYAITEGARARLATVSTNVGGVPKLIKNNETGFVFPVGDDKALAARLELLAGDAVLRRRLGQAVYEKARREFSVEATTNRQLDIYREVLKRRGQERSGVIISGAYGMGNAGDDAILEAIVGAMRKIDEFVPITALSRNPRETGSRFSIESLHSFDVIRFRRVMKKTKLYLSGGGSLIQNVTSRRSLWYYLFTISQAKKLGNAVMMYGCGIGPIVDEGDMTLLSRVLNNCVDVITLRESYSFDELRRFGVTAPKILVSSDPAISLEAADDEQVSEYMRSVKLSPEGRYICFSVRSWQGFEERASAIAQAADYAAGAFGLTPVFVLINHREDDRATELVRSRMKTKSVVIEDKGDTALMIGLLSRMTAMVSMRLHGLIFAASSGVPLVGISYDPKVSAFVDSVGERRLELGALSPEELKEMIRQAVLSYADSGRREATVARLIASEKINSELARSLLER
jgi:polysaccharide pyruvyl transferase CsaB